MHCNVLGALDGPLQVLKDVPPEPVSGIQAEQAFWGCPSDLERPPSVRETVYVTSLAMVLAMVLVAVVTGVGTVHAEDRGERCNQEIPEKDQGIGASKIRLS